MGIVIKVADHDFSKKKVKTITYTSIQEVVSIAAVFNPGQDTIYETNSLDSLKQYLTVTATYDDDTTGVVTNYTLSGTLQEGTSVITVTYEGKTTTFNVTVAHLAVMTSVEAVYTQGATIIYADTPLNDLKAGLVVTAHFDDGTTSNVIGADYNLTGTLTVGTSTITVNYAGFTDTFDVIVSPGAKELVSISAVYSQGQTPVYPSTSLDSLKSDLLVTATYDDSSTELVQAADYSLSGTLLEGTSTVTVTYQGKTDTFTVTVSAEPVIPSAYQQVAYLYKTAVSTDTINTEVQVVPATDTVEIVFEQTAHQSSSGSFACPFGDWWTNANSGIYAYISNTGAAYVRCGKNVKISDDLALNVQHTLSVYHDTILLDGTSIGEPDGTYATASGHGMRVFTAGNNTGDTVQSSSTGYIGRIYSFKVSRNGVLLNNFVPCYRKSDNVAGLYDLESGTFKARTGSTILAGPDVAPKTLTGISAVYTQGQTQVYPDTALDNLKSNLVVTATYDDSSTEVIPSGDYGLSGTLSVGTSTVTVTYGSFTDTFTVTVVARPTVTGISATYTQGQTVVYPSTTLDSLKTDLVVEVTYSDSSTETIAGSDYTLSGTLAVGTSTITVTYEGFTDTFTVTVSAEPEPVLPAEYQEVEYIANALAGSTSAGYVDTGVKVNPATDKVEVEFTPTSFSSYTGNAFGCPAGDYWTDYSHGIYSYITSSGGMTVRCGKNVKVASATDAPLTALTANTKYTLSVYHDTVLINGLSCGTPDGTYATASPWNMYLFVAHHNTQSKLDFNSAFVGQVHSFKVYTNNALTHEFVPCYRKSDNTIGVYDLIGQAFAAGAGTITKGPDVTGTSA